MATKESTVQPGRDTGFTRNTSSLTTSATLKQKEVRHHAASSDAGRNARRTVPSLKGRGTTGRDKKSTVSRRSTSASAAMATAVAAAVEHAVEALLCDLDSQVDEETAQAVRQGSCVVRLSAAACAQIGWTESTDDSQSPMLSLAATQVLEMLSDASSPFAQNVVECNEAVVSYLDTRDANDNAAGIDDDSSSTSRSTDGATSQQQTQSRRHVLLLVRLDLASHWPGTINRMEATGAETAATATPVEESNTGTAPAKRLSVPAFPRDDGSRHFLVCTTAAARDWHQRPDPVEEAARLAFEAREQERQRLLKYGVTTAREWKSLGSETEVHAEMVVDSRERVRRVLQRARRSFGHPVRFDDRNACDGYVACRGFASEQFDTKVVELSVGVQAVATTRTLECQTNSATPVEMGVQYEAQQEMLDGAELNDALADFFRRVLPRFDLPLRLNALFNPIVDEFQKLAQTHTQELAGSRSDYLLHEQQTFTDLVYTKGRSVTCVHWHPSTPGVVAAATSLRVPFEEHIAPSAASQQQQHMVLVWSFTDPIHPLLMLEAPADITAFQWNPQQPQYAVAGCANGQLALWDLSKHSTRLGINKENNDGLSADCARDEALPHTSTTTTPASQSSTLNASSVTQSAATIASLVKSRREPTPTVSVLALSAVETSHTMAVSDLQWLSSGTLITNTGEVVDSRGTTANDASDDASSPSWQLFTTAADGVICVWEARGRPPAERHDLASLHLTWRPFLRVPLHRVDVPGQFGATKFVLPLSLARDTLDGPPLTTEMQTEDNSSNSGGNMLTRVPSTTSVTSNARRIAAGRIVETATTRVYVGTEEGELVCLPLRFERDALTGKPAPPTIEHMWRRTSTSIGTVQRSPFFDDVVLCSGSRRVTIWREGLFSGALFESPTSAASLTASAWSPTRPAVFFVARADGSLEVWDLHDRSHEPVHIQNVTSSPLRTIGVVDCHLALGDDAGTLHILEVPLRLARATINEKASLTSYFERETHRVQWAEEQVSERAEAQREHDKERQQLAVLESQMDKHVVAARTKEMVSSELSAYAVRLKIIIITGGAGK